MTRSSWRASTGWIFLVFLSLPLAQTFPFPGISIADLAFAAAAVATAATLYRARALPRRPPWLLPAILLGAWSVAGALWLAHHSVLPHSSVELAKSLAKLAFYIACATLFSSAVERADAHAWTGGLLTAIGVHSLLGLYVYTAMVTSWGLPYRALWIASQRPDEAAALASSIAGETFVRIRGVAAEPSYLGYFLALGLATAWLAYPARRPGWREIVGCATLVLTLALSSFAIAGVAVGVLLVARRRALDRQLGMALAGAATLLCLALLAPPVRHAVRAGLIERPVGIVTGTLSRGNLMRLHGSYSAAWAMADQSPIFGVGLGNYDVAVGAVLDRVDPGYDLSPGSPGWSVPAYLLATLGWPGTFLFAALLAAIWKSNRAGAALVAAAAVADGTFLGSPFWVFLALLAQPTGPSAAGHHPPSVGT